MNGEIKKIFPRDRIWLFALIGILMLALLLTCSQVASSTVIAEADSATIGQSLSTERVTKADPEEGELAEGEEIKGRLASAEQKEAFATLITNIVEDFYYFDIDNDDPTLVALAHYFSGYLGQIVFFGNWPNGRSGSFGRFIGLHKNDKCDEEVLKHEHGHYVQYKMLGLVRYLFAIAIPSLLHNPRDYYSQLWEVTADIFGGVTTHYHSAGAEAAGMKYLNDVKTAGILSVISGSFS